MRIFQLSGNIAGPEKVEDCWALYHFLKGKTSAGLGNSEDSKHQFNVAVFSNALLNLFLQKVFELEPHVTSEKYVVPYSRVELAELLIKEKDFVKAEEQLLKSKAFPTPYDFDRPLALRITKGLHRVQREKK